MLRRLHRALRSPALQVFLGVAALAAFTWPLVALDRPLHVFVFFFGAWAAAVALLFAMSRVPDDAGDDDSDHGGDGV